MAVTGPDALTSPERQVADLAASGLSNRQIAQHLFITQDTVETHLRHAFRKLAISARADLKAHPQRTMPFSGLALSAYHRTFLNHYWKKPFPEAGVGGGRSPDDFRPARASRRG
jgi:DNA-binding CsgD family transcriptional regulator